MRGIPYNSTVLFHEVKRTDRKTGVVTYIAKEVALARLRPMFPHETDEQLMKRLRAGVAYDDTALYELREQYLAASG